MVTVVLFSRKNKSSRFGGVTVEAVFVLPFLILATLTSVELGRAINQYMILSRAIYEGTRFAATVPGLIPGAPQTIDCDPLINPGCSAPMMKFRNRVHQLLQRQNFAPSDYLLTTQVRAAHPGAPGNYLTISISVDATFNTPIRPLGLLLSTITARVTGPYLFPDSGP